MASDCPGEERFQAQVTEKGLHLTQSSHIEWSKGHPSRPHNWSAVRKAFDTAIIVFLEFYTQPRRYESFLEARPNHSTEQSLAP